MTRTGTFQTTDATGIPSIVTIAEGQYETTRRGQHFVMPTLDVSMQKCGMDFGVLVRIVEPDGPCPLIQVERPFGMDFVQELIEHVTGRRTLPSTN